MATNYEVEPNLAEKTQLSSTTQLALKQLLSSKLNAGNGNITQEIIPGVVVAADIKGTGINQIDTEGGAIDLSKLPSKDIQALAVINVTGNQKTDITIKNNSFSGAIVLNDGDGENSNTVKLVTNKPTVVETGKGDDSVNTGSGADTIVIVSGNDTINTGSGNDKVEIATDFVGEAFVEGGLGNNILSLPGVGKVTINSKGNILAEMDGQGALVNAKNFGALVLGDEGVLVDGSTMKKSMSFATGEGNDTITLGSGSDTIVLAGGNDSINTGAGIDIVKLAANFTGTLTLDGGIGSDKLDLSLNTIKSIEKTDSSHVKVTLDNDTVLTVTNIEKFIYDTNGDLDGGIKTVGLNTIDKLF